MGQRRLIKGSKQSSRVTDYLTAPGYIAFAPLNLPAFALLNALTPDHSHQPTNMSETAPLLPTSVRKNMPSQRQVESYIPSEGSRIHISECMGALKAGKMPSQQQISRMIDLVLQSDSLKSTGGPSSRTARLGEEGSRILEDFKDVLKAFKAWGEGKNQEDLLQNLFYNAASADLDITASTFKERFQTLLS